MRRTAHVTLDVCYRDILRLNVCGSYDAFFLLALAIRSICTLMACLLMQADRHMGKRLFSVCVQVFHGGKFQQGPVCDLHNSHFFVQTRLLVCAEGGRIFGLLGSFCFAFFFTSLALLGLSYALLHLTFISP